MNSIINQQIIKTWHVTCTARIDQIEQIDRIQTKIRKLMISSRKVDQFSSKAAFPMDSVGALSFASACYFNRYSSSGLRNSTMRTITST